MADKRKNNDLKQIYSILDLPGNVPRFTVTHAGICDDHQSKALLSLLKVSFPKSESALPHLTPSILPTTVS